MDVEGNKKKRQRFNVSVLERHEFIEYILDYLKHNCNLTFDFSKSDKHLKFYKGLIREKKQSLPIAIVAYGGSGRDLRDLPTPLQTEFLPLVFEHWNKVSKGDSRVPLFILGHSFDEVFLRKIRLLNVAIPDIRPIQFINVYRFSSLKERFDRLNEYCVLKFKDNPKIHNEVNDFQPAIVDYLKSGGELGERRYHVLDCEVPAGEGTIKSEMIDILALERKRRWLTVIELKFERLLNTRLQSAIFQGLDYCNWVEDHKRSLAMLFPQHRIDVRRRTRLVLINGPEGFPVFHKDFAQACVSRDRYQEIELYRANATYPLSISEF